ncbi:hypothetical protein FVEN_g2188 [Fusarium venenatum]|nr:hypothetical protein FVEN_g2188 [Fusarium venenatum]
MNITAEQAARSHETRSDLMLGVSVALMAVGSLLVAGRLYCRRLIRSTGLDDISAVLALAFLIACGASIADMTRHGLGRHDWTLSLDQIVLYGRCFWLSVLFYTISLSFCKITFLLQYLRIMNVSLGICTLCIPLEAFWDPRIKGRCFKDQTLMWYINGIMHIVVDFAIIVMPLPIVWKLKLPLSQKLWLSGIFGLGFFTIAISILRLQWLTPEKDFTWWNVTAASWSLAELVSGIACSCLSTFKPLLKKVNGWVPTLRSGESTHILHGIATDDSDRIAVVELEDAPYGSRLQIPNSAHAFGTETSITASKGVYEAERKLRKSSKSSINKNEP